MAIAKYNILIAHHDKNYRRTLEENIAQLIPNCEIFYADDGPHVLRSLDLMRINFMFLEMDLAKKSGESVLEEMMMMSMEKRPSLNFLISDTDYSKLNSKGKKVNITYLPNIKDFSIVEKQFEEFKNPKKKKANTKKATAKTSGSSSMDVKLMNPVIDSTLKVLEIMVQLKAEKVNLSLDTANNFYGDISAYYPIKSSKAAGFFCISFPKASYLKTMEAMLFEEFTEINEENIDGIGELCNQIFGNAKAIYNDELGQQIEMATPVVELKSESKVITSLSGSKVVIEFNTDAGNFFVEVCIEKKP